MPFKDPVKRLEAQRRHREKNRDVLRQKAREYMARPEIKIKYREQNKRHYYELKKTIFDLYGWFCNCCGEKNPKFLTIDHVFADGYKHREAGQKLYQVILKDILTSGSHRYQILCYNCNCAKRFNNNICPHKDI